LDSLFVRSLENLLLEALDAADELPLALSVSGEAVLPGVVLGGRVRLQGRVDFGIQVHGQRLVSPFAARSVGIAAVITDHLLVRIGDVGSHQGDPVQGIQAASEYGLS
jgi:hypothetical protein